MLQVSKLGSVLAMACAVAFVATACKGKMKLEDQKPQPMAKTHSSGKRYAVEQPCEEAVEVTKPEAKTLEMGAQIVLKAATAEGDDSVNFEAFYAGFKTTTPKSSVRSFYWKSARKHAKKYLIPGKEKEVGFTICRRHTAVDGKVKIYIRSFDEKKKNTPMTLQKVDDGSWKVTTFSP